MIKQVCLTKNSTRKPCLFQTWLFPVLWKFSQMIFFLIFNQTNYYPLNMFVSTVWIKEYNFPSHSWRLSWCSKSILVSVIPPILNNYLNIYSSQFFEFLYGLSRHHTLAYCVIYSLPFYFFFIIFLLYFRICKIWLRRFPRIWISLTLQLTVQLNMRQTKTG